jgi:hypothetical protein
LSGYNTLCATPTTEALPGRELQVITLEVQ